MIRRKTNKINNFSDENLNFNIDKIYWRQDKLRKARNIFIIIFSALNIPWLVVQVLEYFFLDEKFKGESKFGYIFILLCIVFFVIAFLIEKHTNMKFNEKYDIFNDKYKELKTYKEMINKSIIYEENDDIILKHIDSLSKEKDWNTVLEVGLVSSELFKMLGRHNLRVKNAKYIKEAINNMNGFLEKKKLNKIQAELLIDDIGYSLWKTDKLEEGEKNIREGLALAMKINHNEFISKAYRHLVGIELEKAKLDTASHDTHIANAKEYLAKTDEFLDKLGKTNDKYTIYRLTGFRHYTAARIHITDSKDKLKIALKELEKAEDYFKKIRKMRKYLPDDSVRIYYWRGKINSDLGKPMVAIINYEDGYNKARENALPNLQLKNGYELCKSCIEYNEDVKFQKYIYDIIKLADSYNHSNIADDLRKLNIPIAE